MNYFKISFLTLSILIGLICITSCTKDETEVNTNTSQNPNTTEDIDILFSIHIDLEADTTIAQYFLMASTQNGEMLFDTLASNSATTIQFYKKKGDKIDLTYGATKGENKLNIYTYRNIASNFHLDLSRNALCERSIPEKKTVQLEIQGLSNAAYLKDYNIRLGTAGINTTSGASTFNADNQTHTFLGNINKEDNIQLTIETIIDGQLSFKSLILKYNDWEVGNITNLKRTIHIDDFFNSITHTISLAYTSDWFLAAQALTNDSEEVILARGLSAIPNSDVVDFYCSPNLDIQSIDLSLIKFYSTIDSISFHYHKQLNEIPTQISLFQPTINFTNTEVRNYDLSIDSAYDLLEVQYIYIQNNHITRWRVFQEPTTPLNYQLPNIPNHYLTEISSMDKLPDLAPTTYVSAWQIDQEGFKDTYHTNAIYPHLNFCFSREGFIKQF